MQRLRDVIICLCLLPFWLPLTLGTALAVWTQLGRPLLFREERAGKSGQPFVLVKFRSMRESRDAEGILLPDAERLDGFGRFLRASSLDELPEIWNILRGEMSWVGPRPLPQRYVERYTPEQRRRLAVRPGLTGWAQVCGRNSTTWEQRLQQDVWYVENRSWALDAKILLRTVALVLRRDGISQQGQATMEEFKGTPVPQPGKPESTPE
jgi:sugar transferase EpsL